jgi:hypothetical protein
MLLTFEEFKEKIHPATIPAHFYKTYDRELSYQMVYTSYLDKHLESLKNPIPKDRCPMSYTEAEISEMFRIFEETGE